MSWEFENTLSAGFNSTAPNQYSTTIDGSLKYEAIAITEDNVTTHHVRIYQLIGAWTKIYDFIHPHPIVNIQASKDGSSLAVYDKHPVDNVDVFDITVYTKVTTNWNDRVAVISAPSAVFTLIVSEDGNTIMFRPLSEFTVYTHKYNGAEWIQAQPLSISSTVSSLSLSGDGTTLAAKLSLTSAGYYLFENDAWSSAIPLTPVNNVGVATAFTSVSIVRVREDGNAIFVNSDLGSRAFGRRHKSFICSKHPMEANMTGTALVWSGRDAWSFKASNQLSASTTNPWESANTPVPSESEKLTYHYYFDNNAFGVVTRGCGSSGIYDTWGLRSTSGYKQHNKIYTSHHIDILRWDIETRTYEGIIGTLPTIPKSVVIKCEGTFTEYEQLTPMSNIVVVNNKLFIATRQVDEDDRQRLAVFDLIAKTWTLVTLPGKRQSLDARHIVDGLDGSIWITAKNSHSIIKVDISSLIVTSSVRINRHPYRLSVNQSKELFVASDFNEAPVVRKDYKPELASTLVGAGGGFIPAGQAAFEFADTIDTTDGQISVVDQTTSAQEAFGAARCNGAKNTNFGYTPSNDFFDDGQGNMWFLTDGHVGRMKKTSKEYKTSFTKVPHTGDSKEIPEYHMIPDNSTLTPAIGATATLVSPAFTFEKWTGTAVEVVNVKPYLFALADSGAVTVRRLSALVRKNKYIHRATAMIAVGNQAYYGD